MLSIIFDILVYMMPLESQDESIGYCTFSQVLIPKSDNNLMSLNISQQTATEVIAATGAPRGYLVW